MKRYSLLLTLILLHLVCATSAQVVFPPDVKISKDGYYSMTGDKAGTFSTDKPGKEAQARDVLTLNMSKLLKLDAGKAELDGSITASDGYAKISIYLKDRETGKYDYLIYGARYEQGDDKPKPTVSAKKIKLGVKRETEVTVSSLEIKKLVQAYNPYFDALAKSIIEEHNKEKPHNSWNFLWSPIGNALTYVAGEHTYVKTAIAVSVSVSALGLGVYFFGPVATAKALAFGVAVSSMALMYSWATMPDENSQRITHLKLRGLSEEQYQLERVAPLLVHQPAYVKVELKNASVRSFSIPYLGKIDMSLFSLAKKKNILVLNLEKKQDEQDNIVMLSAHRGYWRNVPANSISAIKAAIARGSDMVEMDLQRTKDGYIVLMHDKSVNRTTNYEDHFQDNRIRKVESLTLAEIKQLKLLDRFGKVYLSDPDDEGSFERVPTLKEALLAAKGKILVNMDKFEFYIPEILSTAQATETANIIIGKGYREPERLANMLLANYRNAKLKLKTLKKSDDAYEAYQKQALLYRLMPGGLKVPEGQEDEEKAKAQALKKVEALVKAMEYTPIVNDWTIEDDRADSWRDLIDKWQALGIRIFETDPESYNSPVLPFIHEFNEKGIYSGTFAPYADSGEGHALQKGRVKFDKPFSARPDWDYMIDNGLDFFVNDRSALMDQYITAIGKRNDPEKGRFAAISEDYSGTPGTDVMVVVHRAAWRYAPENSKKAIQVAIDMGADVLETDVRFTQDEVPLIYHDYYLHKNSNWKQFYGAMDYKDEKGQVQKFDDYGNRQFFVTKNLDRLTKYKALHGWETKTLEDDNKNKLTGYVVNSELRFWKFDDIMPLYLVDRNGNISDQKIMKLGELFDLCNGKMMISLDKWNNCPVRSGKTPTKCGQNDITDRARKIVKTAATHKALNMLIMGDQRKFRGSGPKGFDDFLPADYYSPAVVQPMFTDKGIDYLKEMKWMPRVSADFIRDGVDQKSFIDAWCNLTFKDNENKDVPYVHAFVVKIASPNATYKITQDMINQTRAMITYIRGKGKHVYLAATNPHQTGGAEYGDEGAIYTHPDDPNYGWGYLINKSGLQLKQGSSTEYEESGLGATMLETNFPMEMLRFLRAKGKHDN